MKKTQNFDFDEIMDIREVGEFDTYDFVIPDTHCFIANGIVVHNSGDLEQNADQVWGLYRETRTEEMAELEALKGRDTGTWKTVLRFDRFIQKFYDGPEGYLDKKNGESTTKERGMP